MAAARSIGMLTYRTNDLYRARFGREPAERANSRTDDALSVFTEPQFAVESYLHYQGKKLNDRFDANSYLYLTRAMDTHDIGRGRGGLAAALRAFGETRLCVIAIDSDYLYAASDLRETAELAVRCGVDCTYREMSSIYGHDAFLLEQRQLGALLAELEGGVSIEPHRFPRAAD
jgi:homoserine O-acetyltransferase